MRSLLWLAMLCVGVALLVMPVLADDDPPPLNPFAKPAGQAARGSADDSRASAATSSSNRDDAVAGYVELSDGSLHIGSVYLTRDTRFKLYDAQTQRQREIPLSAIRRLDAVVQKEWLEKEWRFRENANDEKVFTGRSYPVREYSHDITLSDGRVVHGTLSAIVYLQPEANGKAERHLLHKRDKGPIGTELKSLIYVKTIELGDAAVAAARQKNSAPAR